MGYIKNVAKSFTLAAPVILKNKFSDIVHTIDSLGKTNRQEMTQMFKQSGLLIKTQTKSAFSDSLKSIKSGVTTGNFYQGEDVEDAKMMKSMGMSEDDFFGDDGFGDSADSDDMSSDSDMGFNDGISAGPKSLTVKKYMVNRGTDSSSIVSASMEGSKFVGSTILTSFSTMQKANATMAKFAAELQQEQTNVIRSIHSDTNEYNTRQFAMLSDIKTVLEDIRTDLKSNQVNSSIVNTDDPDHVFENGKLNLLNYAKFITKKVTEPFQEGGSFMMAMMMLSNPIMVGLEYGFNKILNSKAFKGFSESINVAGHIMTGFIHKLDDWAESENEIVSSIAKFFRPDKKNVKFTNGNYEKGAIAFDGVTKRSITHVIPHLLTKILHAVSNGKDKPGYFNSDTGMFESHDKTANKFVSSIKNDMSDLNDYKSELGRRTGLTGAKLKKYEKEVEQFMYTVAQHGGMYHRMEDGDFGKFANSNVRKDMDKMYEEMTAKQHAQFNQKKLSSHDNLTRSAKDYSNDPTISQMIMDGSLDPAKALELYGDKVGTPENKKRKKPLTDLINRVRTSLNGDQLVGRSAEDIANRENMGMFGRFFDKFNNYMDKHLWTRKKPKKPGTPPSPGGDGSGGGGSGGGNDDGPDGGDDGDDPSIISKITASVTKSFKGMFAAVKNFAMDTYKSIKEFAKKMWDSISKKITDIFGKLSSFIKTEIFTPFKETFFGKDSKIRKLWESLKDGSAMTSATKKYNELSSRASAAIKKQYNKATSYLKDKVGKPLMDYAKQVGSKISSALKPVSDQVKEFFMGNKETGTKGLFTDFGAKLQIRVFEPIKAKLIKVTDWVKDTFVQVKDKMVSVIWGSKEKPGFLRSFAGGLNTGVIQPLMAGFAKIFKLGDETEEGSMQDKIKTKMKAGATAAGDAITRTFAKIFGYDNINSMQDVADAFKARFDYYTEKAGKYLDEKIFTPLSAKMEVWTDKFAAKMDEWSAKSKIWLEDFVFGDGPDSFKTKFFNPTVAWLNDKVWKPFKGEMVELWQTSKKFVLEDIIEPLKGTLAPFVTELKLQFKALKDWSVEHAKRLGHAVLDTFGVARAKAGEFFTERLGRTLEEKVLKPIKDMWSGFKKWIGGGIKSLVGGTVGFIKNKAEDLQVKHLKSNNAGYMSSEDIVKLNKTGKLKMTPEMLENYRGTRKDFLDKKDAKEKDIAARIEKIKAERELRKAEREKFYAERAAKGKLSTSEKISKHMQDSADEDPTDKTKADIFGEKDVKAAKSATDKATLMTANEAKKSTAIADKQLSEQIKTSSILERLYRFFTGNKSMKIDGDVEAQDTRSNIEKANDDTNIIAASMSANVGETDENQAPQAKNRKSNIEKANDDTNIIAASMSTNVGDVDENQAPQAKNKKSNARIEKKKAKKGLFTPPILTTVEEKKDNSADVLANANDKVNAAKASVEAIDEKLNSKNISSTATNTAATHHAVKHGFTQVTNYLRMMWGKSLSEGIGGDITAAAGAVSGGKKKGILGRLIGLITTPISLAVKAAKNIVMFPLKVINGAATKIGEMFGSVLSGITSAFSSLLGGVGKLGQGLMTGAGKLVEGAGSAIAGIAKSTGTLIEVGAKTIGHTIKAGVTAIGTAVEGVFSIVKSVFGMFKLIGPALLYMTGGLLRAAGQMAIVGQRVIFGMANMLGSTLGFFFGRGKKKESGKIYVTGGYLDGIRSPVGIKRGEPKTLAEKLEAAKEKVQQHAADITDKKEKPKESSTDKHEEPKGETRKTILSRLADKAKALSEFNFRSKLLEYTGKTSTELAGMTGGIKKWLPLIGMAIWTFMQALLSGKIFKNMAAWMAALMATKFGGFLKRLGNWIKAPFVKYFGKDSAIGKGIRRISGAFKGIGTKIVEHLGFLRGAFEKGIGKLLILLGAKKLGDKLLGNRVGIDERYARARGAARASTNTITDPTPIRENAPRGAPRGGLPRAAGGIGRGIASGIKGGLAGVLLGVGFAVAEDAVDDPKGKAIVRTAADVTNYASLGAMIGSFVPVVGTAIGAVIGGITGLFVNQWDNIKAGVGKLGETISETWNSLRRGVNTFFYGDDVQYDADGNVIASGITNLSFFEILQDKLSSWGNSLSYWFTDITTSIGSWLGGAIFDSVQWIGNKMSAAGEWLDKTYENSLKWLAEKTKGVTAFVDAKTAEIGKWWKEAFTGFFTADYWDKKISVVTDGIKTFGEGLWRGWKNVLDDLRDDYRKSRRTEAQDKADAELATKIQNGQVSVGYNTGGSGASIASNPMLKNNISVNGSVINQAEVIKQAEESFKKYGTEETRFKEDMSKKIYQSHYISARAQFFVDNPGLDAATYTLKSHEIEYIKGKAQEATARQVNSTWNTYVSEKSVTEKKDNEKKLKDEAAGIKTSAKKETVEKNTQAKKAEVDANEITKKAAKAETEKKIKANSEATVTSVQKMNNINGSKSIWHNDQADELKKYARINIGSSSNPDSISGLNPDLAAKLVRVAKRMKDEHGETLNISSGYRTIDWQTKHYNAAKNKSMIGKPGGSAHNWGMAIDIDNSQASKLAKTDWWQKLLEEEGLSTPLNGKNTSIKENWHIEQKMNFGERTAWLNGMKKKYYANAGGSAIPIPESNVPTGAGYEDSLKSGNEDEFNEDGSVNTNNVGPSLGAKSDSQGTPTTPAGVNPQTFAEAIKDLNLNDEEKAQAYIEYGHYGKVSVRHDPNAVTQTKNKADELSAKQINDAAANEDDAVMKELGLGKGTSSSSNLTPDQKLAESLRTGSLNTASPSVANSKGITTTQNTSTAQVTSTGLPTSQTNSMVGASNAKDQPQELNVNVDNNVANKELQSQTTTLDTIAKLLQSIDKRLSDGAVLTTSTKNNSNNSDKDTKDNNNLGAILVANNKGSIVNRMELSSASLQLAKS